MPPWIIMSFLSDEKDRVGKRRYKKWSAESRDAFTKKIADVLKEIRGYPSSLFYFMIYFYLYLQVTLITVFYIALMPI